MSLLSTKLFIPPLRPRLVDRPRLIQKLNQGIESGFVLVSAPAGYGKSTLLSAWLSQVDFPFTWLSLDKGDNDPYRFLVYLTAAFGKIAPSLAGTVEIVRQSPSLPPVEFLLTQLINHLSLLDQRLCLVLDDYHAVQNQDVHQAVNFLLGHRPAQLYLVIATRADPPFPLSRLRARSQMMELRLKDLRFSTQEIAEFFEKVMGLNLSQADQVSLEISTEGWAAGLQMAGLSLQGREETSSFIRSFGGDNRYVLDFLFEEVFQRQVTELQDFLLQTAILERFCAPLCNAVRLREDSQEFLGTLERNNLFLIALDEQREWYRYHHLFLDLLKNRLKKANAEQGLLLHQRASAWFEEKHDLENAIFHSLEAQDFEQAARLIEQVVQNLDMLNQQMMLTTWVDRLPRQTLEAHPWLCVYRAWGYFWIGRREAEEEWLQMAENAVTRFYVEETPEKKHLQGHIAAVRAHTALVSENIPRALEMGQKAMEFLPDGDDMRSETAIALGGVYWALGDVLQSEQAFRAAQATALKVHVTRAVPSTCYIGMQQVKQGRLLDALASFQEALRMGTLPDGRETLVAGFPNVRLGDVWRERNELALASQHLWRGMDQVIRLNQVDVLAEAYVCLGRYQLAVGKYGETHQTLDMVERILQKTKVDPWILCWLEDCCLRSWLAEGNLKAVNQWIENCGLSPDGPFSYQHDLHHQNLGRALVAQAVFDHSRSSYLTAASLLERLRLAAERAGWAHEQIKIMLMQAINEQAFGETESALQILAQALSLAQPGGYIRVFLDEGESLKTLLLQLNQALDEHIPGLPAQPREILPDQPQDQLKPYITHLLTSFTSPASVQEPDRVPPLGARHAPADRTQPRNEMIEPLSPRELEVLRLVAQGFSDKMIAQTLLISRQTVHKHLVNIYSKLDVHNRMSAVDRARKSGYVIG